MWIRRGRTIKFYAPTAKYNKENGFRGDGHLVIMEAN